MTNWKLNDDATSLTDSVKAWLPYSCYRSLGVVDDLSQSLEYLGRWESLPVVGGLSGLQGRWQFFMVVNGLSKSSFKLLLLAPNLLTASRCRSFRAVGGRQRYFVLFPCDTNGTTGSLAVFHCRSRSLRSTSSPSQRPCRWLSLRVVTGLCKNFIHVSI